MENRRSVELENVTEKSSEELSCIHSSSESQLVPPPLNPQRKGRPWSIIVSLAYANFWMAAAISIQAPFFPLEAELKGASPTEYGLVFGVFELVVVLVTPVYGKLIPYISPKFLITAGCLFGGGSCCIFGILEYAPAGKTYLALCFVVRVFEALGAAALFAASFTIIAAAFPDLIGIGFSLKQTAFGLGLIVGPTIGGFLYELGGFHLPFVVNGFFLLIGGILLYCLLPSIEDSNEEGFSGFFKFMGDGEIVVYIFSITSAFLFMGFSAATLEPHLRQFNLSPNVLGFVFVSPAAVLAATIPLWGRLCDKGVSPMMITVLGYSFTCVGLLFIGPVPFLNFHESVGSIVGSLVVIGLGLAAKLSSSFAGTMKNATERGFPENLSTYGIVSAVISTVCSLGAFIGPSLGGYLLETVGFKMASAVIFAMDAAFFLHVIIHGTMKHARSHMEETDGTPILLTITQKKPYTLS